MDLLDSAQQKVPQASGLLDLAVDRLRDRLALWLDRWSRLASQLASHPGFRIRVRGHWPAYRRQAGHGVERLGLHAHCHRQIHCSHCGL